jgi:dUTP pyrophosphatase
MKQKRYYNVGENVFIKSTKNFAIVKELKIMPKDNIYKVIVEEITDRNAKEMKMYDLWEIDKDKSTKRNRDILYFSKTSPTGVIPTKRDEDAGYDFYADISEGDIRLKVGKPVLVPTGIATAFPKKYYLNLKHERGSTAKIGLSCLAGVVDSGFRNEIFICLCATYKDVVLTKEVKEVMYRDDEILYPIAKAVAQATLEIVPQVEVREIPYEELQQFTSERGMTMLGQSGK